MCGGREVDRERRFAAPALLLEHSDGKRRFHPLGRYARTYVLRYGGHLDLRMAVLKHVNAFKVMGERENQRAAANIRPSACLSLAI
jgi:hypothetical protein